MRRGRAISRASVPLAAAILLLTGCLPEAVTNQSRDVADLYTLFMGAAAVVFVVVVGLLSWSIIRYRGQPGADAPLPTQTAGHLGFEIAWWALPSALVVVLVIFTGIVLAQVDARETDPEVPVEVEGFQWGWRFTFPDADVVVTGNAGDPPTIHLPVDRTIAFLISSQDVIHSFYIPNFLVKRDAVPGRENRFDVVIDEEGTYGGQCGEYCGLYHSRQLFSIEAESEPEFEAWLAEQQAEDR